MRGAGELFDPRLQPADHLAQAVAHLLHRLHQLADFITPADLHAPTQVTRGDLLSHGDHRAQRRNNQAGDHPCSDQAHQ